MRVSYGLHLRFASWSLGIGSLNLLLPLTKKLFGIRVFQYLSQMSIIVDQVPNHRLRRFFLVSLFYKIKYLLMSVKDDPIPVFSLEI
jgi:hypothetical protein